jgi:hypothetical protein
MLTLDLLSWYYLLLMYDMLVDKNNPNMNVLDLKDKMLQHRNRMDTVHLLVKNDLQKNFDILLDQMMIIVIFLCYYLLDMLNSHHQMMKKMDHKLLMMVREWMINLENHQHYLMMML